MPKTSHLSFSRCSLSTNIPPADVNGRSVKQLARLPAKVLRLHLASCHLVTSGLKAIVPWPGVPAQIFQSIIYKLISVLLLRATFPGATANPLPSTQQPIKKISSFIMWMQAWNLYLLVILSHNPAKVLEMIHTLSMSNLLSHCTPATPKLASV